MGTFLRHSADYTPKRRM